MIPIEIQLTFFLASVLLALAPGPDNIFVLTQSALYGRSSGIAVVFGLCSGLIVHSCAVALGVAVIFQTSAIAFSMLKLIGAAYLVYLAWRIAVSRSIGDGGKSGSRPMNFVEAAAFQWVNPKAWAIAIAAMATYTNAANATWSTILVAVAFFLINIPSASIWTMFGSMLREWLSHPTRLKVFNISMAILLVVSLWPMLR